MTSSDRASATRLAIDIAIKLGLIVVLLAWCVQILAPFAGVILWGAVIAISTYTPFIRLRDKVGGKPAVILFTVIGLGLVIVPSWMFAGSMMESATTFAKSVETGDFHVAPPHESVKDWPVVGGRVYTAWAEAAENFEVFLETYHTQLKSLTRFLVNKAADIGLMVLLFIASVAISAAMLAHDQASIATMRRLFRRLVDDRAEEFLELSVATIRSVTMGVLGIAFFQAVLLGGGMLYVGVPGAALLALGILILVIAQLPALIIMLPVIIWVFSVESTTTAIIFAIYSVLIAMSDIVMKPMLLGRGVEAPMLVVLLGAIGGMLMSGILGLFVGAVVLTLGYKLYVTWLAINEAAPEPAAAQGDES